MNTKYYSYILIFLTITISGCFFVKPPLPDDVDPKITLSPKPEIAMSDELIRSYDGDMIAFVPEGWFLVDIEDKVSADIIAVAVNPDYSLSAVFSNMKNDKTIRKTIEKEGLFGLARLNIDRHVRKSAGGVKLYGKYQKLEMGQREFVKYEFTTTGGALTAKAACFISSMNKFYEVALIPMDISGTALPTKEERDQIFRSILASIKY